MRTFLKMAILQAGILAASSSWADVYTCTAAKERAKVGVYSGNEVATTSDENKQECRFSVNGASTASPPRDRVLKALNLVILKSMDATLKKGEIEPLADLLISASPEKGASGDLLGILKGRTKELSSCFNEFERNTLEKVWIDVDNLLCRGVAKERVLVRLRNRTHGIHVTSERGLLVIGVAQGPVQHFLFVPLNYRQGRPFQVK